MAIELTLTGFVELVLRGANVGLLSLLIMHLLRRPDYDALVVTGLVFCVTGLFEIIMPLPLVMQALDHNALLLLSVHQIHYISMWWFVRALFDDHFCWRLQCFWPVALSAPMIAGASLAPDELVWWFKGLLIALNVLLLAMVLQRAYGSRAEDLVAVRRKFGLVLAFTVPPFMLLVFVLNMIGGYGSLSEGIYLVCCVAYFVLALGFTFWLTSLKDALFERSGLQAENPQDRRELSSVERVELDRVIKVMDGGLYLEPGLTIGGLADRLNVPEHRLRRLINGGLGYRNFAAFVNDYRIDEAKRRLSDPDLAREQIIQHAFSLGYASLAPFNRAFRERVGVSPTEYREAALSGVTTH